MSRVGTKYVELDGSEGDSIVFASQTEVQNATSRMSDRLIKMKATIDDALKTLFEGVDAQVMQDRRALQDELKQFLALADKRLQTLEAIEQRLRLAMRHGAHGRCCCAGKAYCEWIDFSLLNGVGRTCPASVGQDYTDHHLALASGQEAITMDALVDSCLASKGWETHAGHAGHAHEEPLATIIDTKMFDDPSTPSLDHAEQYSPRA